MPFDMGTFGSQSTPRMVPQLRRAAATAREALVDLAAERWEASRGDLLVRDGAVVHPETGQSLTYEELAGGRELGVAIPDEAAITPPEQWTLIGTSVPKVEAAALVTGAHRYASDVALPGMLHGKVLRPAGFGATLRSVDTRAAAPLPGVTVVHEGDFVGVAAPDSATATWALAAIRAEWDVPAGPSSAELADYFRANPPDPGGPAPPGGLVEPYATGSVEDGLAAADHTVAATFHGAYIAHAPLEPRAAVASWEDGALTVWTGTQRPFGVRQQLVALFDLPEEAVRVIVPDTGSGYGGKHQGDAAVEAARLARAAGRPVKVAWTREEEMTWAYFRPGALMELRGGARADGRLVAWEHQTWNAGASALRTPYEVPNQRAIFHPTRSPLRQGAYRALATTVNLFARESLMDELAHAVGLDPLEFRLRNLRDERLRAVLEAAAERFGWGELQPAPGRGIGLACGFEKGGYVATCAEVVAEPTAGGGIAGLRVVRVVEAFECGAVVNPDHLRSTIEGAIVQGIGGALYEGIDLANGRVLNPRFSQYRVPRFEDIPPIDLVVLDRRDLPSAGAGETPIAGIAPAIANALFHATGLRRRALPLLGPAARAR
jgi:isoquinoline 1-oxidoreductase